MDEIVIIVISTVDENMSIFTLSVSGASLCESHLQNYSFFWVVSTLIAHITNTTILCFFHQKDEYVSKTFPVRF